MNIEHSIESQLEKEKIMEGFFKRIVDQKPEDQIIKITHDQLQELIEKGISVENFLDYLVEKHGLLLHGSINKIPGSKLKSDRNIIFASDRAVISIMRSLYSNIDVDLGYPYFINDDNPFKLVIHTSSDGKFITEDQGYIYAVKSEGFKNHPEGSWQHIKETNEVDFVLVLETEKDDFDYPVEIRKDLEDLD